MERTTGPWSLLGQARAYSIFQNALGAKRARKVIVAQHVRPFTGCRVLDVGCGPCDILEDLGEVAYVGVDRSADYIETARMRFGEAGRFVCADVADLDVSGQNRFDVALALGLLHHLDDTAARKLLADIAGALAPGGRLVTIDPLRESPQNPLARLAVEMDRGQNVRSGEAYTQLARTAFSEVTPTINRRLIRIPYSHFIMECRTAAA